MTVFGTQPIASRTTQAQNSTTAAGSSQLDMNAFLRMFTTQLQHQDPSNPLQSYELAAQLAQFSSLAEMTKVNTNLQIEQSMLSSINNSQMVDLLGKHVSGVYDGIQVKNGVVSKGMFQIDKAAETVTVKIYDDEDNLVRTMSLGEIEAGQHEVSWDGKDDDGNTVTEGTYRFDVEASDTEKNTIEVTKTVPGKVFAFRMEEGVPYLILESADGLKLPISVVSEVQQGV
jgi:flagellar basal-body rod modification protein FlgD